jgi:hypothetical protein
MQCGAPVAAARPGGTVTLSRPVAMPGSRPKKGLIAGAAAVLALAAIAGLIGMKLLNPTGSRVVQATGSPLRPGPLTEGAGRVRSAGPLADQTGKITPPAPEPVDIIDYLKFLKDIERQRVLLSRQQMSELLKQSGALTYAGATADWTTDEPEQKYQETYSKFQQSLSKWAGDWQALSQRFLFKAAPQACAMLRDKYYDLLGKTSAAMTKVADSFSQAMGGNPEKAIDALTGIQGSGMGSASRDIGDACVEADQELASVCDRYKLRKDFDIQDSLGGGNLLGR